MTFEVILDPRAIKDIQNIIDYYDDRQFGLGYKFESELNNQLSELYTNPFFQIRYNNVHCLPLNRFPYMIHFTIDEKKKIVTVRGVFHTSRSTDIWRDRNE